MVITFDSSNMAVIAYEILKNRRFEEKKLLVIMLPTIEPSMIPPCVLPLLVFVNVKSGGCQVMIMMIVMIVMMMMMMRVSVGVYEYIVKNSRNLHDAY